MSETLDIVIDHCNIFARFVICDIISQYNITNPEEIYKTDIERDYEKDLAEWIRTGKIIYKENIYVGIENVAKGFVDMLSGKNICKAVVKY
ncbi:hypothetical protein RhiirC2_790002 [Rhizophagus irregularis]|uniref:Uncharacterized protein n=1 Tax=Rhizophagus irregularis TaxID=588596 RepID=A0A2N1MM31_9GLOM|nr:hypothetical protein RhiirC2_790002 [Rhizophagus irregularis]